MKTKPMFMFMNMLFQKLVEPRPTRARARRRGLPASREERRPTSIHDRAGSDANGLDGSDDMAWSESKAWRKGTANQKLYQALLDDASTAPARNAKRRKVVHPEEMPWEMARQGLLKHLINEGMNTRMETVDAYMQIIPPGSRSGKHRHLAEECLYVLEGQRLRPAPGLRRRDHRHLSLDAAGRGEALRVGGGRRDLHSAQHDPPAFQRQRRQAGAADLGRSTGSSRRAG